MSTKNDSGAAQPPDPFDLEALRLPSDHSAGLGVKKLLTNIAVRRPDSQWFIRTHLTMYFEAWLLELKEDREHYLVVSNLGLALPAHAVPKVLRLAITRQGTPFFWPIKLPGESGRRDMWNASALLAAKEAESHWVSVQANMHAGAYDIQVATATIPDPRWDEVLGGKSLQDLLRIAFRDRVIDTIDHPVIKQLRGM
jgi:hypothetical protein